MKNKFFKSIICIALTCVMVFGATACNNNKASKFTINYDTLGGSQVDSGQYLAGDKIAIPTNPTKEFFEFEYWCADSSLSSKYVFENMPSANITLYAKWLAIKSYRIIFDTQGGSEMSPIFAEVGSFVNEPTSPTKEGYVFAGWTLSDGADFVFPSKIGKGDITLLAKWKLAATVAKISYIIDGETFSTQLVTIGEKVTAPELSSDYVVDGWYISESMQQKFNFNSAITASVNLYATVYSNNLVISGEKLISYSGTSSQIILPLNITSIEPYAFENNKNLVSVELNNVTAIGEGAFKGCEYLSQIDISDTITQIGKFAFYGCQRLKNVKIPLGLTVIPEGIFSGCKLLNNVVIPENIVTIGSNAFADCESVNKMILNSKLKTIGTAAFKNTSISEIKIPASLNYLNDGAFSFCSKLTKISVASGNSFFTNYKNSLYSKNMRTLIKYFDADESVSSLTIAGETKKIESGAFDGNTSITSLVIAPDIDVAFGALKGMNALQDLTVSTLGDNGSNVFLSYMFGSAVSNESTENANMPSSLKSVTLLGDYTQLPTNAFYGCNNIQTIKLSSKITSYGLNAFSYSGITEFDIPRWATLETITNMFSGCRNLTNFIIPNSNATLSAYDGCIYDKNNEILYLMPAGKTTIKFAGTTIKIHENAFYDTYIQNLTLPGRLESIGFGSLSGLRALKTLTIPFIGESKGQSDNAGYDPMKSTDYLGYCFGVKKVVNMTPSQTEGGEPTYSVAFENLEKLPKTLQKVTLSSKDIIAVPDYGFYGICADEIVLPPNVKTIGEQAYFGNQKLRNLDLTQFSEVKKMAFMACTAVTKLYIPSALKVGNGAFSYMMRLGTLELAEGVTAIPQECFYAFTQNSARYSNLRKIILPASLESIGNYAFYGVGSNGNTVNNVNIIINDIENSKLKTIGEMSFALSGISNLYLPSSLETIEYGAFAICKNLESIQFGSASNESKIKNIGEAAFNSLAKLKTVTIYKTVASALELPVISWTQYPTFLAVKSDFREFVIRVPKSSLSFYNANEKWKLYSKIIEAID